MKKKKWIVIGIVAAAVAVLVVEHYLHVLLVKKLAPEEGSIKFKYIREVGVDSAVTSGIYGIHGISVLVRKT